jgi:N-acetylmuramic acid 6-phosphate etherase
MSNGSGGHLLAVEGSGAKTQALLTDLEGKALARGFGPGSNPNTVGFESFGKALTTAIEGAIVNAMGPRRAGAPERAPWHDAGIVAACFGLAGVDGPDDEARVSGWIREQAIAERVLVVNDAELVIAAGTPDGWGIALISGTGSVCVGRAPDGRVVRVGGWGPLLGDEGSGYHMALQALRLATQTADGRKDASSLLQAILRRWSLPNPHALIRHVYAETTTTSDLAALAQVVLDAAAGGDPAARAILEQGASDLAAQVDATARKLGRPHPPLALAGSLLRGDLRRALVAAITTEVGPVAHVPDPCRGAVTLAQRLMKGAARPR